MNKTKIGTPSVGKKKSERMCFAIAVSFAGGIIAGWRLGCYFLRTRMRADQVYVMVDFNGGHVSFTGQQLSEIMRKYEDRVCPTVIAEEQHCSVPIVLRVVDFVKKNKKFNLFKIKTL